MRDSPVMKLLTFLYVNQFQIKGSWCYRFWGFHSIALLLAAVMSLGSSMLQVPSHQALPCVLTPLML